MSSAAKVTVHGFWEGYSLLHPGKKAGAAGRLVIGDKGKLWSYDDLFDGAEPVDVEYPKSPGHFDEWTNAIRGGEPAMSNFPDYAGPLAETVLLGNLAVFSGEKVEWDAVNLKATNVEGLESFIKPVYRDGYTLDV